MESPDGKISTRRGIEFESSTCNIIFLGFLLVTLMEFSNLMRKKEVTLAPSILCKLSEMF
jgi:hypothetical protein